MFDNFPVQRNVLGDYDYFSKPDGEEVVEKLWYVMKPAIATSLAMSAIDVLLYSKPKGYGNILTRCAYVSFPIIGCSTAFVLSSNLVAALRKKQDRINFTLGGVAAGAVVGVWKRHQPTGFVCAAVFGFCAYMKKYAVDSNYVLVPSPRPHYSIRSGGYDYTLTKNIPGNYTTEQSSKSS